LVADELASRWDGRPREFLRSARGAETALVIVSLRVATDAEQDPRLRAAFADALASLGAMLDGLRRCGEDD
jgi:hypothetical protein